MKVQHQKIQGVKLIKHDPFIDSRGYFTRLYCKNKFHSLGLEKEVTQSNISLSKFELTLRGFHYQEEPFAQERTIFCIQGSIYDIVVDLRKESQTYLQWESFQIDDSDNTSIYVPKGCANAFLTLKPNTLCNYYFSSDFSPDHYKGIRYDDPLFKFQWVKEPKVISEKDLAFKNYKK
jgi:dTDP-4-dehydrorhamnose 3,5-epimerase